MKKTDIEWHEIIDSTNSEASRRLGSIDNMSVIAAGFQTAGRGQNDHKWHSRAAENLTFSLVLKFGEGEGLCCPLAASEALFLTRTITFAIRSYLAAKNIRARIKWPNDIYVGDRKLAGILIENVIDSLQVRSSIIGVGININQIAFPADLPNPTSLALLTGRGYDLKAELGSMCKEIEKAVALLETGDGREFLVKEFDENVFRRP